MNVVPEPSDRCTTAIGNDVGNVGLPVVLQRELRLLNGQAKHVGGFVHDGHHRNDRLGQRQHDVPVEPQVAGAIEAGGFKQLFGQAVEETFEQEPAKETEKKTNWGENLDLSSRNETLG